MPPFEAPATDYTTYACSVLINKQPLPGDFQVISLQAKQGYQHISSVEIVLKQGVGFGSSPIPNPLTGNLPIAGTPITVKAKHDSDEIELFDGIIVRHKYKNSNKGSRLTITAKTKSINLALSTKSEIFSKQSDKDIIESIVSSAGSTMSASNLGPSQFTVKHTQLVKNDLNDWDFINIRAEANGCFVFTEKDNVVIDKPTPQSDPAKQINISYGQNVFELEIEQDERKYQVANELISFNLTNFETEVTEEESATPLAAKVKGKHSETNYRTFNDKETTDLVNAATQLNTLSKLNGLAHIKADLTARPGGTINISGFNEVVNGKFIITSVMHDYSEGGFSTYIQFGLNHESYRCKFNVGDKNSPSVVMATVTQLEGDPDNLSRIQVKVSGWKHAQEQLWARLSTMYAGDNYGMVLLPEIGDEVILAFTGNDFDTPVVLGSTFSPKSPPHTDYTDDNYDKVFITKKGMKWAWNDEKGIHEISTPKGNSIIISDDEESIVIQDKHSNKITMNSSELNLTGNKDIIVKATGNVKIEGMAVDITANSNMTLKGTMININ